MEPSSKPTHEVIIDGIRYAPVISSSPTVNDILVCLAEQFWGEGHQDRGFQDLRIVVTDDGDVGVGESFEGFAARLATALQ